MQAIIRKQQMSAVYNTRLKSPLQEGAGFESMDERKIAQEVAILFLLLSIPTFRCLEINRVAYGEGIDSQRRVIYKSQDSFTNIRGYDEDCTRRRSSCLRDGCKGNTCCKCKCNEGLTFFSYLHGCLNPDDILLKSGRQCNYTFYYQTIPVVPAIKNRHSLFSPVAGRLGVRSNALSNLISLSDNQTKCDAKSVYEITSTGSTILLDPNTNSGFFEVRHERSSPTGFKGIALNDMQYSTWERLVGRLISLDISCVNSARKSELSSCLLFIVNGTSESNVTYTKASTTHPTTWRTATSVKETRKGSQNVNTAEKSITTQATLNNTTFSPVKSEGGSAPVGAIVGGVLGTIFVIIIIIVLYICYKKRREGSAKETSKAQQVENGNELSSYPRDSMRGDDQYDCSVNPYYKRGSGDASGNDYFSPTEIGNDGGVYYSTIDALKHQKDPKQFEYSYARGMKKDSEAPEQSQYQPLGQSKYEPETYQSVDTGKDNKPKEDSLTQENPYYVPSVESDGLLKGSTTDASKGLSLKNNPGSLEDVSVVYETPMKDTEEGQYEGLTIPPGKNEYQPLEQSEYQDMSYNDKSDSEYMYAAP